MDLSDPSPAVRVGTGPDGMMTYLVDRPPEALPAVRGRDLELAWDAARQAARSARWGAMRGFRFRRPDGSVVDLALADRDARCWAEAVDRTSGMTTWRGLSICLRLLALIDLLARARWAAGLLRLEGGGATLHPYLLRVAAIAPLTSEARFDETSFRACLPRFVLDRTTDPARPLDRPRNSGRLTGATA